MPSPAACLTPDNARIVYVLALCGLRWGELIALRPCDVDFLRRRIEVHRNAVWVANKVEIEDTKGRENRSVPIPSFVLDMLAQQCAGKSREDLLFPNEDGRTAPSKRLRVGGSTARSCARASTTRSPRMLFGTPARVSPSPQAGTCSRSFGCSGIRTPR